MVGVASRTLYGADESVFWETVLVKFDVVRYSKVRINNPTHGLCPFISFSYIKSITFHTLELAHHVGGFTVSKGR